MFNYNIPIWCSEYPPKNVREKCKESTTLTSLLHTTSSSTSWSFYDFSFIIRRIYVKFIITWFYFFSWYTLCLSSSWPIYSSCNWTSKEWILSSSWLTLMLTLSCKWSIKEKTTSSKRIIIYHLFFLLWNSLSNSIFLFFISKSCKWINTISCATCISWLSSCSLRIKSISCLSFIPVVLFEEFDYFI
jgi:hypothetical protein